MPSIDRDIGNGLKIKARDDLENALDNLLESRDLFYYLMFFGMDGNRLDVLQEKYNVLADSMKQTLSELDNGLSICIVCNVRSEDGNDFVLCSSVKGEVARIGCNFTDNVSEADWVVTVTAESEDYNCAEFSGFHVYTSHATAEISIMNGATSETVMTDNVSGSGSHTAGPAFARAGSKENRHPRNRGQGGCGQLRYKTDGAEQPFVCHNQYAGLRRVRQGGFGLYCRRA